MTRLQLHAHWSLVGGAALLAASFACGPSETADTPETAEAPAAVAASTAEPVTPIDLGSTRETAMVEVFYPAPLEVRATVEETEKEKE
jgi:hypothetical protein